MQELILGIGGNQGDRCENLMRSRELIESHIGPIEEKSRIIETAPWGYNSEKWFLNQVVVVLTELDPTDVLDQIGLIDQIMDRIRTQSYSDRKADIDILFYEKEIIRQGNLIIPHERLHLRRFVLLPLSDLRPDDVHPIIKKSIVELLADCQDETPYRWWK